jgi:energy-coupling factor transporter ATP-binding protein EcfA2
VAFGPRNLGLSEDEISRRVEDALLRTGLDPVRWAIVLPLSCRAGSGGGRAGGVLAMEPRC